MMAWNSRRSGSLSLWSAKISWIGVPSLSFASTGNCMECSPRPFVLQRFHQGPVGGWHGHPGQLLRQHPLQGVAAQGSWLPVLDRASEEMQLDCLLRIRVADELERHRLRNLDAQLLSQFPAQTFLQRFARFSLSPRKLPESAQMDIGLTHREQIAPIVQDQRCGDFDWLRDGHQRALNGYVLQKSFMGQSRQ